MSELPQCAGPKCKNKVDPRWSPFCDGCGCVTEEDRKALISKYIDLNRDYFALIERMDQIVALIQEKGNEVGKKWIMSKEIDGIDSLQEIANRDRLHDFTNATLPLLMLARRILPSEVEQYKLKLQKRETRGEDGTT